MARHLGPGERLVLASHNAGKLAEIADLVRPLGLDVVSAGDLGLTEPAEDAPDFVGNARIKALAAARASGLPALADDSGFCVAALGGVGEGFRCCHDAGECGTRAGGGSARVVCRSTVPRLAGRAYRDVRRTGGRDGGLAAARDVGVRL